MKKLTLRSIKIDGPKNQLHTRKKQIAILGGGPSGLFICKRLIESGSSDTQITIFEKRDELGSGMPYSKVGANVEHITNVSANEIPEMITSVEEWIKTVSPDFRDQFDIDVDHFNTYKVLPRLLFGAYLNDQFALLLENAKTKGIDVKVMLKTTAQDVMLDANGQTTTVVLENGDKIYFDHLVMCTGHVWPSKFEHQIDGYFDSPYPPSKLAMAINHTVALKGASLTAIDAVRTLARANGDFKTDENGFVTFALSEKSTDFKIKMHSRSGMFPAVRIHLENSHLKHQSILTEQELAAHRATNGGFISLDFIFDYDFKAQLKDKDPKFYDQIKSLNLEQFVEKMMALRERASAFDMLSKEYEEAEKSIEKRESVYWKEMLAVLSFALNQPAKYLSAEDMLRLKTTLMPLIAIVIAFVPQSSCKELFALRDAGVLDLTDVGDDGEFEPNKEGGATFSYTNEEGITEKVNYRTFVDCIGQCHLSFEDFPFKTLREQGALTPAKLQFKDVAAAKKELEHGNTDVEKSGNKYLMRVPGVAIGDNYEIVDHNGHADPRIFIMAVPHIAGFNPDYSGLDFCEQASSRIVDHLKQTWHRDGQMFAEPIIEKA